MIYGSSPRDMFRFRNGRSAFMQTEFIVRFCAFVHISSLSPFRMVWSSHHRTLTTTSLSATTAALSSLVFYRCIRSLYASTIGKNRTIFAANSIRFSIAGRLANINPGWSSDKTFQEARKIVGAIIQHITYTEYLPKVIGGSLSSYSGYDSSVNPGVASSFTSAAYRFGHGMIQVTKRTHRKRSLDVLCRNSTHVSTETSARYRRAVSASRRPSMQYVIVLFLSSFPLYL